jgi:hypothetical protein
MAHSNPPNDSSERNTLEDGRAEWSRPALHRLNVGDAERLTKISNDGIQGKGFYS